MYWLMNSLFPTSVGTNTFLTIMLAALTTTCDGGALLTTQGTHICLILSLILRGCRVAFFSPNVRRDMVLWSIRRVTDLPPNANLREMQQNIYGLVQLIAAATPAEPQCHSHRKEGSQGVLPYMFNVCVLQKRMSVLHGIFGKRCEPGGYITLAVSGVGTWLAAAPLGEINIAT